MNIREEYEKLSQKEYKFSLIDEVNILKDQCIRENNDEYSYKCTLLISDIYIEHQNNEEALRILLKDMKTLDSSVFSNIYLDYLDRLVYLYINRRNYKIALKYIEAKEKALSPNDTVSINRMNLEYSYVYGEMGSLDNSEHYLNQILNNNPDDELKAYVLSNLTKIYIDKHDIVSAKYSLNQCLTYEQDHEGEVYCDYLLAKICVLEDNSKDALKLYDNIFEHEEINQMTLAIMNDYLKLLNKLKMYDKSLLLMNKLSLFVNACNDLGVKKEFYQNQLDYFVAVNDNSGVSNMMKEIKEIEVQLTNNEQMLLNANFEDEKNDIVEETEAKVFTKIDTLTSLVDIALKGNTLREIIMDYSNKVHKIISFNELTFVLFNKVDEQEFQINDYITCLKYKKERLYEKNIAYEDLKGTIIEMMINKSKPVAIDLSASTIDVKDIFDGELYSKIENRYLNIIPCKCDGDTFAAVVYSSADVDLTDYSNTVLLKVATKALESSLIIQFTKENSHRIENTLDMVVLENNIGLFYSNNNTMYLSEHLKKLLQIKYNSISVNDYMKKIVKADLDRYKDAISTGEKYIIKYKYELPDKVIQLVEICEPCLDINGKKMYYQGTIRPFDEESVGYALGEKDLRNRMFELKQKTNIIEFKFSLIKIQGSVDEYVNVKNTFGVEPYYLNDGTFIVILENEANQRTLDKYVKNFASRCAIIRCPRDIINVDEMLPIAKLMLENNELYFTNDIYREFIKKNNLLSRFYNILTKGFGLKALNYNTYNNTALCEIKPLILGINDKDNVRKYLTPELITRFDEKLINTYLTNCSNINSNCFFELSNEVIYRTLTENNLDVFKNVTFVMYEYNKISTVIFNKLKELGMQIIIHENIIDLVDAYYFTTGVIKGIYIPEKETPIENYKFIKLANMFDLSLICYNAISDYDKICYYNGNSDVIE